MIFSKHVLVFTIVVTVCLAQNTILEHFLHSTLARNRDVGRTTLTFPFTKWCGPGSTARHYNDLGHDTGTDMCCRDHDHCGLGINPGSEVCEFKNNGFKISSCECDEQFKECLRSHNSVSSRIITELYRQFVRKCLYVDPFSGECEVKRRRF